MLRTVLSVLCAVELLAPKALMNAAEGVALENPDACEWRRWVVPGARLEGLLFLVLLWRDDASYASLKRFLGYVGLVAFLFPRAYVDYGSRMAYTSSTTPTWRPWVYTGTRLIGLCYLLIGVRELRRHR
jgi:hypothetical protein